MGSSVAAMAERHVRRPEALRWWLGSGAALTVLALTVRRGRLLPGELMIARVAQTIADTPLHAPAWGLDVGLNDERATILFIGGLVAVALRWGLRAAWLFALAGLATSTAKMVDLVARPRPGADLSWGDYLPGYGGFPSGHVVYVTVLAVTVSWLSSRFGPNGRAHRMLRVMAWAMVAAIGPARAVTNDHWPADIAAGYLLAVWFLSGGVLALPLLDRVYDRLVSLGVLLRGERPLRSEAGHRRRRALPR